MQGDVLIDSKVFELLVYNLSPRNKLMKINKQAARKHVNQTKVKRYRYANLIIT